MSSKKSSNLNSKQKPPEAPSTMARRRKNRTKPNIPDTVSLPDRHPHAGLLVSIISTLILAGIPFGLGKHIEFNSPGPFDSGAFVYSAQHLLNGAQWGVDELSSARPNTLLVNIIGVKFLGFNDIGPKIIQMILQLAALVFMFITLRKIFGSAAGVLGTTIAAVYLSAPLIAKFGNVKEQFMIAFMVYAACSFLWYEYTQKRYWLVLTGFFAIQPYYFKPTGLSVAFAIVLYLLISRAVSRKWKMLWLELTVFLCGFVLGLVVPGSLYAWQGVVPKLLKTFPPIAAALGTGLLVLGAIPIGIHTLAKNKNIAFIIKIPPWGWGIAFAAVALILMGSQWNRILAAAGLTGHGYLADSISARGLSELAPQVFRYYKALSTPILAAMASIAVATAGWCYRRGKKTTAEEIQSQLVWVLAIWWILDMAFIWVSPRSYEQYYLPPCASAAMLSGFVIWKWQKRLLLSVNKIPWLAGGLAMAITVGCLSIPIFIGQRYSPDTGDDRVKRTGHRYRGFGPALKELPLRKKGGWVAVGDYIHTHSSKDDTIYVWGWVPGIYVQAQRLAPVPKAFESDMHVTPPPVLASMSAGMVTRFKQTPPKFIVDSLKMHFPNDRPPLELWPIVRPKMFGNEKPRLLTNDPQEIAAYDKIWTSYLETKIEPEEARRYEAMKPFREFVMNNYRFVGQYGDHMLFEYIESPQKQIP